MVPTAISRPPEARARVEPIGGFLVDAAPFGVHLVLARVFRLHRKEGPRADVQRQRLAADAVLLQPLDQTWREMQRRRGRSYCSLLPREHGLVVVAVLLVCGPARGNVGRQRHPACALEQDFDGVLTLEVKEYRAFFVPVRDGRVDAVPELDNVADAKALGVAYKRPPVAGTFALVQRCTDARFAPPPFELRRDHTGIVEHECVTRPKQVRQVKHGLVRNLVACHQQQPRRIPRLGGPQRD